MLGVASLRVPFFRGMVAAYALAIPIGPIAILILELGIHRGFWVALSAGAGAASADLIYAAIAVNAGMFLVSALATFLALGAALSERLLRTK